MYVKAIIANKIIFYKKTSFLFITDHFLHPTLGCQELGILDKEVTTNPEVTGSIGKPEHYSFWKNVLKAPKDVLNVVRYGYKIPFLNRAPPSSELPNNKSALRERAFVEEQLFTFSTELYDKN